ncbi:MAG: hypothetical protein ABR520_10365, partial [Mycobacteriales bacterium]
EIEIVRGVAEHIDNRAAHAGALPLRWGRRRQLRRSRRGIHLTVRLQRAFVHQCERELPGTCGGDARADDPP